MKLAIITFTGPGIEKARAIRAIFPQAQIFVPPRLAIEAESGQTGLRAFQGGFRQVVASLFKTCEGLIFISAAAIAVRAIAPYLAGKDKDPAVVVVDEGGRFAISLLSGHLGGANELAEKVARRLGSVPVITTATDGRGLPAFDNLARSWGWTIENLPALKSISAALLENRKVFLYSDQLFNRALQGNISVVRQPEILQGATNGYIVISNRKTVLPALPAYPHVILRPRNISAGVGCRRGVNAEDIILAVKEALHEAGRVEASLNCITSGEFKAGEKGLIEAAGYFKVPFRTFGREQIEANIGESPTSEFVMNQVGVGAVAEPCALIGSGGGEIIVPVRRGNGITVALAEGPLFPEGGER